MKRQALSASDETSVDVLSPPVGEVVELNGFRFWPKKGMIYVTTRGISARVNQNFDAWPAEELRKSYKSFSGRPCFVNHHNDDPTRTRGIILGSRFDDSDPDDVYIALLIEVDAENFPKLAREIESGGIDGVSMGAMVGHTICSVCENKAVEPSDFCEHIALYKGSSITHNGEQKIAYELCHDVNFFEISFVFDPADETALLGGVYSKVAKTSAYEDDQTAPPEVDTYRSEEVCPKCESDNLDSQGQCPECGYEKPPEGYDDPDLEKAKQEDLRRKDGPPQKGRPAPETRERMGGMNRKLALALRDFRKKANDDSDTNEGWIDEGVSTETATDFTDPEKLDVTDLDETTDPEPTSSESVVARRKRARALARFRAAQKRKADVDVSVSDGGDEVNVSVSDDGEEVFDEAVPMPPIDEPVVARNRRRAALETARRRKARTMNRRKRAAGPNGPGSYERAKYQDTFPDFFENYDRMSQGGDAIQVPEGWTREDSAYGEPLFLRGDPESGDYWQVAQNDEEMTGVPGNFWVTEKPEAMDDYDDYLKEFDSFDEAVNFVNGYGKTSKRRANRRKRASEEDIKYVEPDDRVDVEDPIDTTNADAEESQYDGTDYDNQGDPGFSEDDSDTNFGWIESRKKASSMKSARLAEAYVEHGLIESEEKWSKMAEFENTASAIVEDRLELLAQIQSKSEAQPRTANRSSVPQFAAGRRGRPSMRQPKTSATNDDKNSLLFLS